MERGNACVCAEAVSGTGSKCPGGYPECRILNRVQEFQLGGGG